MGVTMGGVARAVLNHNKVLAALKKYVKQTKKQKNQPGLQLFFPSTNHITWWANQQLSCSAKLNSTQIMAMTHKAIMDLLKCKTTDLAVPLLNWPGGQAWSEGTF